MNKRFIAKIVFIVFLLLLLFPGKSYTVSVDVDGTEIAVEGYDPVAYHTENHATKGYSSETHEYKDMLWYFSSTHNKELFIEDPEKYAPSYLGFCAYYMSRKGFKKKTDPRIWSIVNERLFLFSNEYNKEEWQKDSQKHIEKADKNWEALE